MFHIYSRTFCDLSLSNSTPLYSPILLFSNSLSSLVFLQNMYSPYPIVQRIQILCHSLSQSGASVFLIRIPGHSNIPGNESVDMAAKNPPPSCRTIYYLRSKILNLWQNQWSLTSSKLLPIKPNALSSLPSTSLTRYQEKLHSRLRIGHTRLTHSFLLLNLDSPTCPFCQSDDPLTVAHLLVSR